MIPPALTVALTVWSLTENAMDALSANSVSVMNAESGTRCTVPSASVSTRLCVSASYCQLVATFSSTVSTLT